MSLDELLKEPEEATPWQKQRRKLLRWGLGLGLSLLGIALAVTTLLSFRHPWRAPSVTTPAASSDSLLQLMRLQRETNSLREDVERWQRPPRLARQPAGVASAPVAREGRTRQVISYDPGEGFTPLTAARADLYIPTGAVFQARLLTPIKTSVDRTFVMAETINEYRMDMKRRIPRGSRLIGRSRLNPVLKGVVVEFETLVTPQGVETSLSGLALSRNALPEIEGLYFSDRMLTYGTALAFGFLSGFADAARTREVTLLGAAPDVSLSNQVLAGLSTASFQVANEMLADIRANAIEYVVVPAGEQVFVVLTRRYDVNQGAPK